MKGAQINSIVISVVHRSCAIPVAWHILPANKPGQWVASAVSLLKLLSEAVPPDMTVLVMTDRGLRSPRLWEQIRALWGGILTCVNRSTPCSALKEGPACQRERWYRDPGTHMLGPGRLSGTAASAAVRR